MAMITVSNLTFCYDGSFEPVFEQVSFQIDTDWKLGFIGRNGRGKTTFLKLLTGAYTYKGKITASVDFEYFPFSVENGDRNTWEIAENICPDIELWQLQKELSLLEVDWEVLYRPFHTLSGGEKTKVLLAVLFLKKNAFLLIDEPTNHLDDDGRRVVGQYLLGKKGFILVSHDRAFLDSCTDHILSVNRTNIDIQKGNFSSWYENKQRRDQFEQAEDERLKKDIRRLGEAARRTAQWSDDVEKTKTGTRISGLRPDRGNIGHKAAKMMKRAKSVQARREQAMQEKTELLHNIESCEELKITHDEYHSRTLCTFRDLCLFYDDRRICGPISGEIKQGHRIALRGKNGSGKSSLLKLLRGEFVQYTGTIQMGKGVIISYVPQETSGICGTLTEYARIRGIDESRLKTILRKMDFSRAQFEKKIENYSEGQKKKVLLAASLCENAHLYIWDEPLNFIDIFSRIQIEKLLISSNISMLFVEHDKAFADNVATDIFCL